LTKEGEGKKIGKKHVERPAYDTFRRSARIRGQFENYNGLEHGVLTDRSEDPKRLVREQKNRSRERLSESRRLKKGRFFGWWGGKKGKGRADFPWTRHEKRRTFPKISRGGKNKKRAGGGKKVNEKKPQQSPE